MAEIWYTCSIFGIPGGYFLYFENFDFWGTYGPKSPKNGPETFRVHQGRHKSSNFFLFQFFLMFGQNPGGQFFIFGISPPFLGGHRKSSEQLKLSPVLYARCYLQVIFSRLEIKKIAFPQPIEGTTGDMIVIFGTIVQNKNIFRHFFFFESLFFWATNGVKGQKMAQIQEEACSPLDLWNYRWFDWDFLLH